MKGAYYMTRSQIQLIASITAALSPKKRRIKIPVKTVGSTNKLKKMRNEYVSHGYDLYVDSKINLKDIPF